jgi:hypothetical protein
MTRELPATKSNPPKVRSGGGARDAAPVSRGQSGRLGQQHGVWQGSQGCAAPLPEQIRMQALHDAVDRGALREQ